MGFELLYARSACISLDGIGQCEPDSYHEGWMDGWMMDEGKLFH